MTTQTRPKNVPATDKDPRRLALLLCGLAVPVLSEEPNETVSTS